jgi:hypothetical protein
MSDMSHCRSVAFQARLCPERDFRESVRTLKLSRRTRRAV